MEQPLLRQVLGGKRPWLLGGAELAADPTPWDVQKSAGRGIDRHRQLGHVGCLSIGGLSLPTPASSFPWRAGRVPTAPGRGGKRRAERDPEIFLIPSGQRDLAAARNS